MPTPERDRSVERLLAGMRRASGSDAAAAGEACLEAADLAAWADGALPASRAAAVESHLATCARCQAIAAAFVKSEPAAAPSWWRRWPILVPIAAAAAASVALALWTRGPAPVAPPSTTIAETQATPVPVPPALVPAPPSVSVEPQPPAQPGASPLDAPPRQAPPAKPGPRAKAATPSRAAASNLQAEVAAPPAAAAAQAAPPAVAAAPPPPPPPPAAPALGPLPLVDARKTAAGTVMDLAAERPMTEFTSGSGSRDSSASVRTPVKWRIFPSGAVQRSFDNGSTWAPVALDRGEQIVAGVAPSPQVCWLIGRGGLVLLMTNGLDFRSVTRPTTADLRAIRIEGTGVIVSAVDGSSFVTTDGGQTWARAGAAQDLRPRSF